MRWEITGLCVICMAAGCGSSPQIDSEGLQILVTIGPQKYFVERIAASSSGNDFATVSVLIPPGASPVTWELSPSEMRWVSDADIWFTAGVMAEREWSGLFRDANENLRIADPTRDIQRLPIERYGDHGHGGDHHHHEGDSDPHVWLSPEMVKSQARVIAQVLIEVDGENAEVYSANLEEFLVEIDLLQEEMHDLLDPLEERRFIVFHPAWGYFADEFSLIQLPIEAAGSEPSPGELAELLEQTSDMDSRVVFVSPQFSMDAAETMAEELGADVAVLDPLSQNWAENMLIVAQTLNSAVE